MKSMPLVEHLEELRTRLVHSTVILLVAFFACYEFSDKIAEFLLVPLRSAMNGQGKIIYLGIFDKMVTHIQLSLWSGVLLSSPLWFREVWLFVKPGLYDHEIKAVRPFLFVGFFLFWAGVAFTYYLVFPFTIKTLMDYGVSDLEAMIDFKDYVLITVKILVVMGLVFQLPNLLLILGFMELVTKYTLRKIRRYVYVGLSIISAVITPPDVISMMAMWIPLVVLYEIGILAVALIVHPYLKKKYA